MWRHRQVWAGSQGRTHMLSGAPPPLRHFPAGQNLEPRLESGDPDLTPRFLCLALAWPVCPAPCALLLVSLSLFFFSSTTSFSALTVLLCLFSGGHIPALCVLAVPGTDLPHPGCWKPSRLSMAMADYLGLFWALN